jgi:hypothetical protein
MLDTMPLWWMFERRGWSQSLSEVRKRFYCSRCLEQRGRKVRGPKLQISLDPPQGAQFAYPDERTWKRLVSRYRS